MPNSFKKQDFALWYLSSIHPICHLCLCFEKLGYVPIFYFMHDCLFDYFTLGIWSEPGNSD